MATLASCRVKKATMIPVALATLATLRSISAQRMTKVRPVAMISVTEEVLRRNVPLLEPDGYRSQALGLCPAPARSEVAA